MIGGALYLWRLSPIMTATTAGVAAVLVLVATAYGSFTRRTQRVRRGQGKDRGSRGRGRLRRADGLPPRQPCHHTILARLAHACLPSDIVCRSTKTL